MLVYVLRFSHENHCILIPNVTNQEHQRQNFTVKKIFVRPMSKRRNFTNRNERTEENVVQEPLHRNLHSLKNGRRKVCFCLPSWRVYFGTRKQTYSLKEWTRWDRLKDFWKRRTKTGKLYIFQPLSWMKTIADLSSPSARKIAPTASQPRFEV